jgi:PHD/YefM family antitoxin component YafN of YafNO toxin-antitoxin module
MLNMNIKPSAAIRKNYNEISVLCKTTKEPVFLTKNGEGDLVVMDIATYSLRESMLRLREQLVAVEEDRLAGKKGFLIDELDEKMKKAITESVDGRQ